jgi:hypothetical protein
MDAMKNRVAWGLALVLSIVVLIGIGGLFVNYHNHLPEEKRWMSVLPRDQWGIGPEADVAPIIAAVRLPADHYRLGLISMRVK